MSGDGDPFDFPDPEDDEESGEDDWDDEEGDDDENEDNVRTYAASDCERTITERRAREQDTVKVPAFPTLPSHPVAHSDCQEPRHSEWPLGSA